MRLQGLRGIEQAVENGMKKENLKIEYGDFAVMKVINEIRTYEVNEKKTVNNEKT